MKQIPLLQGKALLIELPEGATNPEVHTRSLTFDTPMEVDEWGYDYQSVKLPAGNWRIIGMLSEVGDAELADVTGFYYNKYNERYVEMPTSAMRATPIGDIEDAIRAEGYYLDKNPLGKEHPERKDWQSNSDALDDGLAWVNIQSRVLCRERCLLLGREGL